MTIVEASGPPRGVWRLVRVSGTRVHTPKAMKVSPVSPRGPRRIRRGEPHAHEAARAWLRRVARRNHQHDVHGRR